MRGVRWSARWGLSAYLNWAGWIGLGLALFGAGLVAVHQENRLIYRIAHERMESLRSLDIVLGGETAQHFPGLGYAWPDGMPGEFVPAALRALRPGYHLLSGVGEIDHVVVQTRAGRRWAVVYGDALHQQRMSAQLRLLVALFVVFAAAWAVLAKGWAGALLARHPAWFRRAQRAPSDGADDPLEGTGSDARARLALRYGAYREEVFASQQREREFIANVGHELRTPITSILTGCELLAERPCLDEVARRQLTRVVNAAEHMDELVHSFMILARDGNFGRTEAVELRACVLKVLDAHAREMASRQLALKVQIGAEVVIETNREALFAVVSNLIKNAVKYTERGGISVHYLGQTLYVADTGAGMEPEALPQLYQPFFRTQRAAESGVPGLGLGLAIVKRICDHYGWAISARSTLGRGTTMSIEFHDQRKSLF